MDTLVAILACVALVAASELARFGIARVLGVPFARVAKCFFDPRGGRRWARVLAIFTGTLAMYLGVVAVAFAFYRDVRGPTATTEYRVDEAVAGFPAAGKFERGDHIVAVNGAPIGRSLSLIVDDLGGAPVRLTVRRGDATRDVTLEPVGHDGHWMLGLRLTVATRSYGTALALQRAFELPIAQATRVIVGTEYAEPGGPTRVFTDEEQPFADRVLRELLWLATTYLLLLVVVLDLVRAVRAVRR